MAGKIGGRGLPELESQRLVQAGGILFSAIGGFLSFEQALRQERNQIVRHWAAVALVLALWPLGAAAESNLPLALDKGWKFRPGDDLSWAAPELDDSDWAVIEVPGSWGNQGYPEVEVGWYRLTLERPPVEETQRSHLALALRNVSTGYQLYAGGKLIGTVGGPPPKIVYDRHALLRIPPEAISADGRLVLALRVWRADAVGRRSGGIRQTPHLGLFADLQRASWLADLPKLLLAFLFLAIGLFHLLLSRLPLNRGANFWFGLLLLAGALAGLCRSQLRFDLIDDYELWEKLEFLTMCSFSPIAIEFHWKLLERPVRRGLRSYQLGLFLLGVITLPWPCLEVMLRIQPLWLVFALPGSILIVLFVLREAWRGSPEARILAVGSLVMGLFLLNDGLAAANLVPSVFVASYGFVALTLFMGLALIFHIDRVYRDVLRTRSELELRVEQRTHELQKATLAAQASSRAKSEFLANMSHEIRTPIGGILGVLELMNKLSLPPKGHEYLQVVRKSADNLLHIIDDILDFSKIEAGAMRLEIVPFELRPTVSEVVELLRPRALAKNLELRLDLQESLPVWVQGDPFRLRQVLLNLIGNALKFTERGHVIVRVGHDSRPPIGSTFSFTVEDTGNGIAPEIQQQLFGAFQQADASAARRFGGSGLGLAISKKLVELAGGGITLKSEPGHGTVIVFYLPLAPTIAPAAKPPTNEGSRTQTPRRRWRILLAEDDPVQQLVAETQLLDLGFEVEIASNGHGVIAALESGPIDLILMDCQMPDLDGYETTRRIRSAATAASRVPIIAFTAHVMAGEKEKCLAAGMNDYISKPFKTDELIRLLDHWLTAAVARESSEVEP